MNFCGFAYHIHGHNTKGIYDILLPRSPRWAIQHQSRPVHSVPGAAVCVV